MSAPELPEHVAKNRAYWDEINAPRYVESGRRSWATDEISWGIFGVPEDELGALPSDVAGMDVIELGCGTAYFSAWLARRGARVTGIDNSEEQLKTARKLQDQHDLHFPLIHGNAETTGLPDAAFDLAISEYGASIWADPYRWIPEAARILRPGGELVFLTNGLLWILTVPDTEEEGPAAERLLRPYFGMHRFEWPDDPGVEFHLGFGDWVRLLRANRLEVIDFIEVQAPAGAAASDHALVDPEWARKWPAEQIWRVRKAAGSARIASMDSLAGFGTASDVEVDVLTNAYRISGTVQTRFSRLTDILNQLAGTHLTIVRATIAEHADPTATVAAPSALVAVSAILVMSAPSLTGAASSDMRIAKRPARAQLAIPPLHVTGTIHVTPGGRPIDGVLNMTDRFLAMTDATISSGAYPELERTVPAVAVARDHAQLLLMSDDEQPDGLLADVLDEEKAEEWLRADEPAG